MKFKLFFNKTFVKDGRIILYLWIAISVFMGIFNVLTGRLHNNYKIYKYVFFNTIEQFPLYQHRPQFFDDVNHYGPVFGVIMAPFALMPDLIGATLWLVFLSMVLYYAVKELPLMPWQHMAILLICTNSMIIAQTNVQFNTATTALIILSFTLIKKERDGWAAFMIMLGTFVKLYGIVGFAFFFFSKHKPKLILWSFIWGVIFFVLPMFISSPGFIAGQYKDWFNELIVKNQGNGSALQQNVSFLGMIHKSTGNFEFSNLPILLVALSLFALPYMRIREYRQDRFQLLTLASVLIFTVLFSTGSEPNTYVIALTGVAIWFIIQPRPYSKWSLFLITFGISVSSFGPSDLFPRSWYVGIIRPFALQALPCTLIWLTIVLEMIFRKSDYYLTNQKE
ncbi:MAG: DUF2029 domain-containing protein [Prolixibacteraceae bacterium]|nr:DUF2029 domain-containing protein [Prolixibacteraceae bacterium]